MGIINSPETLLPLCGPNSQGLAFGGGSLETEVIDFNKQ